MAITKVNSLERNSDIPLYRQLYFTLVNEIERGDYRVGECLPSDRALAEQYKVSRITASQAVEELVKAGIVYREQGRGTFIANPGFGRFSFRSFSADTRSRGKKPSSKVIQFSRMITDAHSAKQLRIPEGSKYLEVVRVRFADNSPVAIQKHALISSTYPELTESAFEEGSLLDTFKYKYGIVPKWIEAGVRVEHATEGEAKLLNVALGSPLIVVDAVTYTETFDVVEWVITRYRSEGMELYIGRQRIDDIP